MTYERRSVTMLNVEHCDVSKTGIIQYSNPDPFYWESALGVHGGMGYCIKARRRCMDR